MLCLRERRATSGRVHGKVVDGMRCFCVERFERGGRREFPWRRDVFFGQYLDRDPRGNAVLVIGSGMRCRAAAGALVGGHNVMS